MKDSAQVGDSRTFAIFLFTRLADVVGGDQLVVAAVALNIGRLLPVKVMSRRVSMAVALLVLVAAASSFAVLRQIE